MKIEINNDSLLKAVTIADSIIPSKSVNTILGNCLFNVSKDEIEIISTDNEIAIKTRVDAISDDSLSFTANGKRLSQILKELPKGEVILDINDSFVVNIKSKSKDIKGSYKLIGTAKNDYPEINSISEENTIEFDQAVLKDIIKKVAFAAASDAIKPVFNGIFFITEDNEFTAVSSDSRRLSKITRSLENSIDLKEGIIVPLKTISELYKLLNAGLCRFSVKDNQCFFKLENTEIISRLIDGQFPNYKQVIPKEYLSHAIIDNKKFMESLRRAMIFTREPSFKVILNFSNGKLKIEAKTPDLGEAKEELEIDIDIENELTIGINAQYVMDALKEIDSYGIKLGLTGQMSPVTFTPEDNDSYISVVMPIQIKNQD